VCYFIFSHMTDFSGDMVDDETDAIQIQGSFQFPIAITTVKLGRNPRSDLRWVWTSFTCHSDCTSRGEHLPLPQCQTQSFISGTAIKFFVAFWNATPRCQNADIIPERPGNTEKPPVSIHLHQLFISPEQAQPLHQSWYILATRLEYEDYLGWCARHFEKQGMVSYGQEVIEVVPDVASPNGKVTQFQVISRDLGTFETTIRIAKRVVIAIGGKAMLPEEFSRNHPGVIHSSKYSTKVHESLKNPDKQYNIAVIGSGQGAAEIFNDLPSRYPNAKVTMIIKGSALRPSDDSPFVNEVFDPDRVDGIFQQQPDVRAKGIALDRATNYSVVRLELLEHLYQRLYSQRLQIPNPEDWKIHIKTNRRVVKVTESAERRLLLKLQKLIDEQSGEDEAEELAFDAVFVGT
jgi:thioredoxin reductase